MVYEYTGYEEIHIVVLFYMKCIFGYITENSNVIMSNKEQQGIEMLLNGFWKAFLKY